MPSKFLRKLVTLSDLAKLNFQPAICDFCGEHAPEWIYAAERTSTGKDVRCWRWCACPDCAELVESERFDQIIMKLSEVLRRNSLNRVPLRRIRQAADQSIGEFHKWSIRNPEGWETSGGLESAVPPAPAR